MGNVQATEPPAINIPKYIKSYDIKNYDEEHSTMSNKGLFQNPSDWSCLKYIQSDVDHELLIFVQFEPVVDLKSITIYCDMLHVAKNISAANTIKLYNIQNMKLSFDDIKQIKPIFSVKCKKKKLAGGHTTKLSQKRNSRKLHNLRYLALFIDSNQDNTEKTFINGINFGIEIQERFKNQINATPEMAEKSELLTINLATAGKRSGVYANSPNIPHSYNSTKNAEAYQICKERVDKTKVISAKRPNSMHMLSPKTKLLSATPSKTDYNKLIQGKSLAKMYDYLLVNAVLSDERLINLFQFLYDNEYDSEAVIHDIDVVDSRDSNICNIADDDKMLADVKEFFGLPKLSLQLPHSHFLTQKIMDTKRDKWRCKCDKCNEVIKHNCLRFVCELCNFDLCELCYLQNGCKLEKCDYLRRITSLLIRYEYFLNGKLNESVILYQQQVYHNELPSNTLNKYRDIQSVLGVDSYNNCDILNDFNHLLYIHDSEFAQIHKHLLKLVTNGNGCHASLCHMLKRNYRDRCQRNETFERALYFNSGSRETATQQIIDKIHSFYFHTYDMGWRLKPDSIEKLNEETKSDEVPGPDPYGVYDRILSKLYILYQQMSNQKQFVPTSVRSRLQSNRYMTHTRFNGEIYDLGIRYFYWDYFKNNTDHTDPTQVHYEQEGPANLGYLVCHWYIHPKFRNLKDELLNNALCKINVYAWNYLLEKGHALLNTDYGKQQLFGTFSTFNTFGPWGTNTIFKRFAKIYGYTFGDTIKLNHLVAMIVYCNFDEFQRIFSSTYRKQSNAYHRDWNISIEQAKEAIAVDNEIKQRHSNFAHVGKFLRELECFGSYDANWKLSYRSTYYQDSKGALFYHGISTKMMLSTILPCVYGPFSTTTEFPVALRFAGPEGIVLSLSITREWYSQFHAFFDAHWVSAYPHEQEKFFIGGRGIFKVQNILEIVGAVNYEFYMNGLLSIATSLRFEQIHFSLKKKDNYSRLSYQMAFRLLCHEMNRYNPTEYPKLNSIPPYIETLLHNYCQTLKEIIYFSRSLKLFSMFFAFDSGLPNFDILTTIFPSLKNITSYTGCEFDESMLQYVLQCCDTCTHLQRITFTTLSVKSSMLIQNLMKKYQPCFHDINWCMIYHETTHTRYKAEDGKKHELYIESLSSDHLNSFKLKTLVETGSLPTIIQRKKI